MGYMKIQNLYKAQGILLFRECYALEKIHGTSAHVAWDGKDIRFFSGGAKHDAFVGLFDEPALVEAFQTLGCDSVVVYGEAYGGKWAFEADPIKAAQMMIEHIDKKRKTLGIDKARERVLYDMEMRRELE